eukprot:scaffold691_cov181-Ochromonas_danica.AAC.23
MNKGSNLSPALITKLRENSSGPEGTHYLDFNASNLGPLELTVLADTIRYNGNNCEGMAPLITIDLSSNRICGLDGIGRGIMDNSGLNDFCAALTVLSKVSRLKRLVFNKNYLALEGSTILNTFFSNGPNSLQEVCLRSCAILPEAFAILCEGLKNNKSLYLLDLRDNPMDTTCGKYLAEVLTCHPRLKEVNVNSCGLGRDGCQAVFQALSSNATLETLSINANQCSDIGCEAVSSCLRTNTKLRYLDLQENNITVIGATLLARGLARNRALVFLGLQWNILDDEAAIKLAEGLTTNNTLRGLHLLGTAVSDHGVHTLLAASLTANERPIDVDVAPVIRPSSRSRRLRPLSREVSQPNTTTPDQHLAATHLSTVDEVS